MLSRSQKRNHRRTLKRRREQEDHCQREIESSLKMCAERVYALRNWTRQNQVEVYGNEVKRHPWGEIIASGSGCTEFKAQAVARCHQHDHSISVHLGVNPFGDACLVRYIDGQMSYMFV